MMTGKYENKRNGKIYLIITEPDEKTKTVLIRDETGKEQNVTLSTVKRWYVKIGELEAEKQEAEKQEPEKKKTRKGKDFSIRDAFRKTLTGKLAETNCYVTTYEKVGANFIVVREDEKSKVKFEFILTADKVIVQMKEEVAELLELEYTLRKGKYYLPAGVVIRFTDETAQDTVNHILSVFE